MTYGNYAPFYRTGYFNPMQTPMMPNMVDNQNQFAQPYQMPTQTQPMSTPMPNYDFTERTVNAPKTPAEHVCKCGDKFVTIEAFNTLQGKFEELTARFEEITSSPTAKTKKSKENADNE